MQANLTFQSLRYLQGASTYEIQVQLPELYDLRTSDGTAASPRSTHMKANSFPSTSSLAKTCAEPLKSICQVAGLLQSFFSASWKLRLQSQKSAKSVSDWQFHSHGFLAEQQETAISALAQHV